jgi:hypothetical protein
LSKGLCFAVIQVDESPIVSAKKPRRLKALESKDSRTLPLSRPYLRQTAKL